MQFGNLNFLGPSGPLQACNGILKNHTTCFGRSFHPSSGVIRLYILQQGYVKLKSGVWYVHKNFIVWAEHIEFSEMYFTI